MDLAIEAPQSSAAGEDTLTSVENLEGTEGPDVLRGNSASNRLESGLGDDVVEGRGGDDRLDTGGDDTLDIRDAGPDAVDCGPGADAVTADLPGIDTLTGCEAPIFPTPAGPGPGGGGIDGAPLRFGSKTRVTLELSAGWTIVGVGIAMT